MVQVNLVNERDEVVGHVDLLEAHRGKGLTHQAVSLFLFRKNAQQQWEILLQRRSHKKLVGGLQWANTLCAHPKPQESHSDCVKRRLQEELGVIFNPTWLLEEVMVFPYQVRCDEQYSENEIDHFFAIKLDERQATAFTLNINPDEVVETSWVLLEDLLSGKHEQQPLTPWTKLFLADQRTTDLLRGFLCR